MPSSAQRSRLMTLVMGQGSGAAPASLLPFSDEFTTELSARWSHLGWTIVSGTATANPTIGETNLVTNGTMETGSPPSSWIAYNATAAADADAHGGSQALKLTVTGSDGKAYQSFTPVANTWYIFEMYSKMAAGAYYKVNHHDGQIFTSYQLTDANYAVYRRPFVRIGATNYIQLLPAAIGAAALFDDISIKPVTFGTTIAAVQTGENDIQAAVVIVRDTTNCGMGGFILSLDNPDNPQNYVVAFLAYGVSSVYPLLWIFKCVSGTLSKVSSTGTDWTDGQVLTVIKSGDTYTFYRDQNILITTNTISDATIVANTYHGLFSLGGYCTFDNFYINSGAQQIFTALGDSITSNSGNWFEVFTAAHRYGCNRWNNRAVGGSIIMPAAGSMDAQVVSTASDDADYIIICLGQNDGNNAGITAEYQENILELAGTNTRAKICCMGILPTTSAYRTEKNAYIAAAVAGAIAAGANAEYWNTDNWIDPTPGVDTPDGVHTNASGAAKVAAKVAELIGA